MISLRLQQIANMLEKGMILADIGSDHAFLPIYAIENGITVKAYACDVRQGPLQQAIKNIGDHHLENQIVPILSDGFQNVPMDTQVVVIAGMGYHTAQMILEQASSRLTLLKRIYVQINDDVYAMRKWISDHHYTICQEAYIHEKGHDYITIGFEPVDHAPYSEKEWIIGPILSKQKEEAYQQYCKRMVEQLKKYYPYKTKDEQKNLDIWIQAYQEAC